MALSLRAVATRPLAHAKLTARPSIASPPQVNVTTLPGPVRHTQRLQTTVCRADSGSVAEPEPTSIEKFADRLATLFPLWVFIGAVIGIFKPEAVTWFSTQMFSTSLGFLMLCMGLTLSVADFKACAKRPAPILVGYVAQYVVKPVLGFLIAKALSLPDALAVGLILVSCCPGGQASNVATFIAHGDVALSVLMTSASTIGAIVMTPLLTKVLAGTLVPVNAWAMAQDVFSVVLVPTVAGVALNELCNPLVRKIKPLLPLIGVLITTMLCASPVGQVSAILKTNGAALCLPVGLLHVCAFALGYFICKTLKFTEKVARTVSIETGMQSAALGFLLAQQHFSDPLVAVPSAVSVVFMALGGSSLAVFWRGKPVQE